METRWCSITEYSRRLNVSEMTIRRRIKSGKLLTKMADGKYYIDMSHLNENSTKPPQEYSHVDRFNEKNQLEDKQKNNVSKPASYLDQYRPNKQKSIESSFQQPSHFPLEEENAPFFEDKNILQAASIKQPRNHSQDFLQIYQAFETRFSQFEQKVVEDCTQKMLSMQAIIGDLKLNLQTKDHELEKLKQNQEDLELLVKMLDPNPSDK